MSANLFWIFAVLAVLGSLGVLAPSLRTNPASSPKGATLDAMRAFFRDQLDGIDRDHEIGRISADEAIAARAELAREVLRQERDHVGSKSVRSGKLAIWATLPAIALVAVGIYVWVGRADLPNAPLAGRETPQTAALDIEAAIATVEARMAETPDDVRGWLVLAPIYMEQGRYAEAANAWRRILALEPPTADRQTNLAEALILVEDGAFGEETLALLESAMSTDPLHVRSRFYLAGELTRSGQYDEAVALWEELLAIATGEEAWVETARSGLAAAQAGTRGENVGQNSQTIEAVRGMVDGLADRLDSTGGNPAEWIQLVRSRNQLDGPDAARSDLERGLAALSGEDRLTLEDFGRDLGLVQ